MNVTLASAKIDSKIKHRILNEFLIFVDKNPQYAPDLEKAIAYFDNDKEVDVAKEIGKFYHSKKQWDKAIKYYEKALKNSSARISKRIYFCFKRIPKRNNLSLWPKVPWQ